MASEIFYEDTAANFQKVLKDAIASFGIPRKLLLDNGAPYANEQLSLICGTLGIVIVHARPRDGAEKGKQERYWRRVKEQLLFGLDMSEVRSIRQFNDVYAEYVHKYNHGFHEGIQGKLYERYDRSPGCTRRPESPEWLNTSFMNRITRKVKGDATVTIDKVQYDVPQQFIRAKVEIRYVPCDMGTACIYSNGQKFPIRKTDKVENSRTRRKTTLLSLDYVRHKINCAGGSTSILSDAAFNAIHGHSHGTPRIIDNLMRDALVIGAQNDKQVIDPEVILAAVENRDLG